MNVQILNRGSQKSIISMVLFLWFVLGGISPVMALGITSSNPPDRQVELGPVPPVTTADQVSWPAIIRSPEDLTQVLGNGKLQNLSIRKNTAEFYGLTADGQEVTIPIVLSAEMIKELQTRQVTPYNLATVPWLIIFVGAGMLVFSLLGYYWMRRNSFPGRTEGQTSESITASSNSRLLQPGASRITFQNIAGLEEPKQELNEILMFLKEPETFTRIGARMPRGVILFGPPGTGKTLLAKALAGEAQASFFAVSGSDFLEKYVGIGASRIRNLFENARKNSPAIIFIDEIDAVGRKRSDDERSNEEKDRTLNQLLVEMDGFNSEAPIVIMGATNRLDMLDQALLRPGRFDRHIAVDAPTVKERQEILRLHMSNKPIKDIDLQKLAQRTPGFTGADLANMCNEAAIIAARNGKELIEIEDVEKAIDRVTAGLERKAHVLTHQEKQYVAYHESGHALVTYLLKNEVIHRISIIPRGKALGFVLQTPDKDKSIYSKQDLQHKIMSLLGGRAAEEVIFKNTTTSAQNDLARATEIALKMVGEYGMGSLGLINYASLMLSYQVPTEVFQAAQKIIEECYTEVIALLEEHRSLLERLAQKLMQREIISGEELSNLLQAS